MRVDPSLATAAFRPPTASFGHSGESFEQALLAQNEAAQAGQANVFGAPGFFGHSNQVQSLAQVFSTRASGQSKLSAEQTPTVPAWLLSASRANGAVAMSQHSDEGRPVEPAADFRVRQGGNFEEAKTIQNAMPRNPGDGAITVPPSGSVAAVGGELQDRLGEPGLKGAGSKQDNHQHVDAAQVKSPASVGAWAAGGPQAKVQSETLAQFRSTSTQAGPPSRALGVAKAGGLAEIAVNDPGALIQSAFPTEAPPLIAEIAQHPFGPMSNQSPTDRSHSCAPELPTPVPAAEASVSNSAAADANEGSLRLNLHFSESAEGLEVVVSAPGLSIAEQKKFKRIASQIMALSGEELDKFRINGSAHPLIDIAGGLHGSGAY